MEFLHNYGGGWQELLPSCNDACTYRGVELPFHGEVAVVAVGGRGRPPSGERAVELVGRVRCARTPFALERRMRLERGAPTLTLRERVENVSGEAHAPRLGPPLRRRRAVPRGRLPAARAGAARS